MLNLTNRRTIETFSCKYIIEVNNKTFEILSNFDEKTFKSLMTEISNRWEKIKSYEYRDCIEFQYTNENRGITLDDLENYL